MRHILAPVDFSDVSAAALRFAAGLSKCSKAQITALFADQFLPPPYFTAAELALFEEQFRESRDQAAARLRDFVDTTIPEAAAGVESRVIEGPPIDAILTAAQDLKADLIVMGSHGRGGINRLMLGSVTERTIRESDVPVLAVRGDQPGVRDFRIQHILCPVNDSAPARQALERALEMAACFGATLTAVHVHEPGKPAKIEDLAKWTCRFQRPGCTIEELVRKGDASEEVIELARQRNSDLIVVGASHRRFFEARVLSTNTVRILRHAPCPVLAVPAAQAG